MDKYKRARMDKICILRESGYSFKEISLSFDLSPNRIWQIFKKGQRIARNIVVPSTVFDEPNFRKVCGEDMTPKQFYERELKIKNARIERNRVIKLYEAECASFGYTTFDEKINLFDKYFKPII